MSDTLLLFCLLLTAVLLGWLFGRRSMTLRLRTEPAASQARYLSDLDRLITVEKSSFVNALSKILDEDQSGVEFYLVIAALLRRRGEVEYAIECHQTLLNRFAVDSPLHGELIFELAKDYIHAGLHDRAELLLNDLVERYPVLRIAAMEALLELHQGSREWHEAIAVGARMRTLLRSPALLLDAKNQQRLVALHCALAHYHCELAEAGLATADHSAVRTALAAALKLDRKSVRASWLLTALELELSNQEAALRHLRRVRQQAPEWLADTVVLFLDRIQRLAPVAMVEQWMLNWLDEYPSVAMIMVTTEFQLQVHGPRRTYDFLLLQLHRFPSFRPLLDLLERHFQPEVTDLAMLFRSLKDLSDQFMEEKSKYLCSHCGFKGTKVHWQCPSCREWNSIKPIFGRNLEYR